MTNCCDIRTKVSTSVYDVLKGKSKLFGVTTNEYVRFLILKDVEKDIKKSKKAISKNLPDIDIEGDD